MFQKERKRVCVVGAGTWGRNHIRTLHEMGSLGGVVEEDIRCLEWVSENYPYAGKYQNVDDAIKEGFDGYVIATPSNTHFQVGRVLLENAQNILIEKPMTLSSKDALELVNLAEKNQCRLMTGHILLFHPAIRRIKELILEGKIGKLWYIYSNRLNLGRARAGENALWSLAPHDISVFNYLTGELPVTANAFGSSYLKKDIHDTVIAVFKYPEGIMAHTFASWLHPDKQQKFVIIGSKGMLTFSDSPNDRKIIFYDKGIEWINGVPVNREGPDEVISYEYSQPLENELRYFLEHLDSKIAVSDGICGMEIVQILESLSEHL